MQFFVSTILFPLALAAAPEEAKTDFWITIDALHGDIVDAEFDYEFESGKMVDGELSRSGPLHMFVTGIGAYQSEGVVRWETDVTQTFVRNGEEHSEVVRTIQSYRTNGDQRTLLLHEDSRNNEQYTRPGSWHALEDVSGFARFWAVPMFRMMPIEMRNTLQIHGEEDVDGHRCQVVTIDLVFISGATPETKHQARFWLDMARGGNFLRREFVNGPNLLLKYHSIELLSILDSKGTKQWFPVAGFRDVFFDVKKVGDSLERIYLKEPTQRIVHRVLRESVRLNTGIPASEAEVNFDGKTMVHDVAKIAARAKPLSARERATRATASADDLTRAIEEAEGQKEGLQARKPVGDTDWMSITAMGLAVVGLLTLASVFVLKRRRDG